MGSNEEGQIYFQFIGKKPFIFSDKLWTRKIQERSFRNAIPAIIPKSLYRPFVS